MMMRLYGEAHDDASVRIGAIKIPQRLLQRLTVHLAQPCGCGLLFQHFEFSRKIVVRQRFASLSEVIARAAQRPIPDESPRARKLIEQIHLLGSRVKAIAIGCLNRSVHGAILPDQVF